MAAIFEISWRRTTEQDRVTKNNFAIQHGIISGVLVFCLLGVCFPLLKDLVVVSYSQVSFQVRFELVAKTVI